MCLLQQCIHMWIWLFILCWVQFYHIGYISCGFLPLRIAFPVIASCLKGPSIQFPDSILIQSFLDYVSTLEGTKLHHTLQSREFTLDQQADVISILSRMGCREMPTAANLKHLIV